jgi:hypothetical protein
MNTELTADRLRELLSYDAETGAFTWLSGRGGTPAGARAGTRDAHGYVQIQVAGRLHKAHRLAWLYVTGEWPSKEVDHANGDRGDNRIANLREATSSENKQNQRRAHARNKSSGLLGVSWHEQAGRWRASICVDRKSRHLGLFDTAEAAHRAYTAAKAELHPFAPVPAAA